MIIIDQGIQYEINENDLTAKIVHLKDIGDNINIPALICYESKNYDVKYISKQLFANRQIKSISFSVFSSITTIPKKIFSFSTIEKLDLPANVQILEEGWCFETPNLIEISVSPENKTFRVINNQLINLKEDTLYFVSRDIETITIDSKIKRIAPYCFEHCKKLKIVNFPENSKIETIGKFSFSKTALESITIPNKFINIDENAFFQSKNVKSIIIDQITEIQTSNIWSIHPEYDIQSILNINCIDKELIHNIYSQFQFKYHSFDKNSDDQNFISNIFYYLMKFKLIIYYFDNTYCVICAEGECLFIDKIEKIYIEHIINLLKIQQITLFELTEKSTFNNDVNNEIDGFCTNFKKIIDNNGFIKKTIRPIIGYMIRKFYYPSSTNDNTKNHQYMPSLNYEKSINNDYFKDEIYKLNNDRLNNYYAQSNNIKEFKTMNQNDIIELRDVGIGNSFRAVLSYQINDEHLCVIKKPNNYDIEIPKLLKWEINNYMNINHPCIPQFYGIVEYENQYIPVIEFINGQELLYIKNLQLTEIEKYIIICQLISVIDYFHHHHLIYRDLKLNNLIIDQNKNLVILDFDRMIDKNAYISSNDSWTTFITSIFSAPEVNSYFFNEKVDIYSLGKIIYFIMNEQIETNEKKLNIESFQYCPQIKELYDKCIRQKPDERIFMSDLIIYLCLFFADNNIILKNIDPEYQYDIARIYLRKNKKNMAIMCFWHAAIFNHSEAQYELGIIYKEGDYILRDINKAIYYFSLAANNHHSLAQYELSIIYKEENDINKAIHFLSLSADNNCSKAQYELGLIYYKGKHIKRDIDKAINYLFLASNQNNQKAQVLLGKIYYKGKYVERNINIAIHYFNLAENQNDQEAQFFLGLIYEEYGSFGIEKAIHYYTLAADQNNSKAQIALGNIYLLNVYVNSDFDKAIYYYSLAADQDNSKAQFILGSIYYDNIYTSQDIDKAIYYFSLAADHNYLPAQYRFACILYNGKYVSRDIDFAVYYLKLSANQNIPYAQYLLGIIYYEGKYVNQNINKAMYYFNSAADQKLSEAQYILGNIYKEGKYVKQNINKAMKYFLDSANQNNLYAYISLFHIYYMGKYVKQDIEKAINYLSQAANRNLPIAQLHLGLIYIKGKYIPRDISKGLYLILKAANQNNDDAQYHYGMIYFEGEFVKRNTKKAIYYLTLSAYQNNVYAQCFLGKIYFNGQYVPQDIKKSFHYYSLAAEQNIPTAYFSLGSIYFNDTIFHDINKAAYYYTLASNQNIPESYHNLGFIYSNTEFGLFDINKAIHYYTLAANCNIVESQVMLGKLYFEGKFIERDITKSIFYFSLASDHNNLYSQIKLGYIYLQNSDIQKSIQYYTLAANQKDPYAQCSLGKIYYEGKFVARDIERAIHFFSLAAEKEFPEAQFALGKIYYEKNNINQAIKYFTLASNQNFGDAQYELGLIYDKSKYVTKNLNKAIYYYSLAAQKNVAQAQTNLAMILQNYYNKYTNINKIIYYYTLAANNNEPNAQHNLGIIFYIGYYGSKNIYKGIDWIICASKNNHTHAHFALGFIYQKGEYLEQDITNSIYYYKKASSFYSNFAKNNLGIIYKNGFGEKVTKNLHFAEIYFKEAINQKNDMVSMYNLAHMYIYNDTTEDLINQSINLLIKSSELGFEPSIQLLCLILIKKNGMNIDEIYKDIKSYTENADRFIPKFKQIVNNQKLNLSDIKEIDFLYNIVNIPIISKDAIVPKNAKKSDNIKYMITEDFYKGFGDV